eukprot:3289163-Pyramimonas_sp.AAC.1
MASAMLIVDPSGITLRRAESFHRWADDVHCRAFANEASAPLATSSLSAPSSSRSSCKRLQHLERGAAIWSPISKRLFLRAVERKDGGAVEEAD